MKILFYEKIVLEKDNFFLKEDFIVPKTINKIIAFYPIVKLKHDNTPKQCGRLSVLINDSPVDILKDIPVYANEQQSLKKFLPFIDRELDTLQFNFLGNVANYGKRINLAQEDFKFKIFFAYE